MATAPRTILTTDVEHLSVMVASNDIKTSVLPDGLVAVQMGRVYAYLDWEGVDVLVEQLTPHTRAAHLVAEQAFQDQADAVRQAI